MNGKLLIFDRAQLRRQRQRSAGGFARHDFLFRELAERLLDRLADIRQHFPLAADLSPQAGLLDAIRLASNPALGGIKTMVTAGPGNTRQGGFSVICDEEVLPFQTSSLDLILSCMGLHWVNDLPGALVQIRDALRPDGLFLAVLLGGNTLSELRQCLMEAELIESGGVSPRVSPMLEIRDAAGLLQRAGFALPVADIETINVTYPSAFALMQELRGMGETNALIARSRQPLKRTILTKASALYVDRFADHQGRISATFQAIFLTGWAPAARQQQPARRGSGEISLTEIFKDKG